jgi:site-specific DNA-methyltransferase (adenine-specific)
LIRRTGVQQGDCLDLMMGLPSDFIPFTLCSPPYDGLRNYNGFHFDFPEVARELYRVTAAGGVVVWVVADETVNGSETGTSFRQALGFLDAGFSLWDTMIFAKRGISHPEKVRYHSVFEYMFVLSKGRLKTFNPIRDRPNETAGRVRNYNDLKRAKVGFKRMYHGPKTYKTTETGMRFNVWEYPIGQQAPDPLWRDHPAVMPLRLAYDHVRSWSKPDQLVFDPLMGSGTTLVAAQILGRNFLGFETSQEYCELAEKRLGWYAQHGQEVTRWLAPSVPEAA